MLNENKNCDIKVLSKIEWLKNLNKNGKAQEEIIKQHNINNVMLKIWSNTHGQLWTTTTPDNLLKMIKTNKNMYEIIKNDKCKIHFDIDKHDQNISDFNEKSYLKSIKDFLNNLFPNALYSISGSIDEESKKISYHIIISNYIINTLEDKILLKCVVEYIREFFNKDFDNKIYTKNRCMKLINQSKKEDKRIQLIIEDNNMKNHIITAFFNEHKIYYNIPDFNNIDLHTYKMLEKCKEKLNITKLPQPKTLNLNKIADDIDINELSPNELLKLLPINKDFDHTYTHYIQRFCFYNDIKNEDYISWIKNKHGEKINMNKYIKQWSKLNLFPGVSIESIKYLLYKYYPNIKKDKYLLMFKKTFDLENENIKKVEKLSPVDFGFIDNEKYKLYNIGMGGGKTAQTINHLRGVENFLWMTPNIALSRNTLNRLNEIEDGENKTAFYQSFKSDEKETMKKQKKLIICLNSLHYLDNTKYDTIIIDEIETLLLKFEGDFINNSGKKSIIFKIFCNLLKNARSVIFLDAFITTRTINFIKDIEESENKIKIFERLNNPITRHVYMYRQYQVMLLDLIEKIKEGNKIFIYYPYKKCSGPFFSMNKLFSIIKSKTNKNGNFYNADVDDEDKYELSNVNESWKDYDFIITNNIITCGLNYDNSEIDFDYKYIFVANFSSPRDIIQVSARCRNLSSNIIKISYMGKMSNRKTLIKDYLTIMNTGDKYETIYKNLFNSIVTEQYAPIKETLNFLLKTANYKIIVSNDGLNEEINNEYATLLKIEDIFSSYKDIEDIDYIKVDELKYKIIEQNATYDDKMIFKKYHFKNSFVYSKDINIDEIKINWYDVKNEEDKEENAIETIWDNNLFPVIEKIRRYIHNSSKENEIFKKIQIENKTETIFLEDLTKINLSKNLKNEICELFQFKNLNIHSTNILIVKEVYNSFFNYQIINSKHDNKAHRMVYNIDTNFLNSLYLFMYEYTKKENNIKLSITENKTYKDGEEHIKYIMYDDEDEEEDEKIISKKITDYNF